MHIKLFILLLTITPFFCQAQLSLPNSCLNDRMDSQDIYNCSKYKRAEADSILNNVYKKLNEKITTDYKASPLSGNILKGYIKKSQRTWINLRDENCTIETFVMTPGTPAFETTKNICIARESTERARYLKDLRF